MTALSWLSIYLIGWVQGAGMIRLLGSRDVSDEEISTIGFSPSGKLMAVGCTEGDLSIYSLPSLKRVCQHKFAVSDVEQASFLSENEVVLGFLPRASKGEPPLVNFAWRTKTLKWSFGDASILKFGGMFIEGRNAIILGVGDLPALGLDIVTVASGDVVRHNQIVERLSDQEETHIWKLGVSSGSFAIGGGAFSPEMGPGHVSFYSNLGSRLLSRFEYEDSIEGLAPLPRGLAFVTTGTGDGLVLNPLTGRIERKVSLEDRDPFGLPLKLFCGTLGSDYLWCAGYSLRILRRTDMYPMAIRAFQFKTFLAAGSPTGLYICRVDEEDKGRFSLYMVTPNR